MLSLIGCSRRRQAPAATERANEAWRRVVSAFIQLTELRNLWGHLGHYLQYVRARGRRHHEANEEGRSRADLRYGDLFGDEEG